MNKVTRYIIIAFLFLLLILVRAFAPEVFYDPMINYFEEEYMYISPEGINSWKLFFNMFLRFLVNTSISVLIIYFVFKRLEFVKFSIIIYILAFVILSLAFFYLLNTNFSSGHLLPFYIRRFIIHPVILLVLLPAFYYQRLQEKQV